MSVRVLEGDARVRLPDLPSRSVQCVVTSPPYWGLRDYGTATWEGGDDACDHRKVHDTIAAVATSTLGGGKKTTGHQQEGFGGSCRRCGATRVDSQLGLERTPDEYVAKMVEVFREVRRVLRDDGTLWLNLGDSYAGGKTGRDDADRPHAEGQERGRYDVGADQVYKNKQRPVPAGMKPKDLVGIPWRVAFALQADGWYLRSDIIWHKPNPMPESVTDRPTKAHEYLFLLTKSERYFYDAEAIAEESEPEQSAHNARYARPYDNPARIAGGQPGNVNNVGIHSRPGNGTRNKRSVWTVSTSPFPLAHFATFPPKLVEPCILAGTSPRACEHCGAPWGRVVERTAMVIDRSERTHDKGRTRASGTMLEPPTSTTLGWQPTCDCEGNQGIAKCVVLDPFGGAGTTGLVADRLGRDAILVELNPEYARMARERITTDCPLFTDVA